MGQGEEIDHEAAGLPVRQTQKESVEGAPVGLAGKELVAVNEVQQRHRLLAQAWMT